MTQNTAAGEWKTQSQTQVEQNGKRWSRKAVKTIWQIRYALQCGTVLLIWELGLLNLSFHYSNRNPKDICSIQRRGQRARSVVLTVKSEFIFHFKMMKCLQCHPMDILYTFRSGINSNHRLLKASSSSLRCQLVTLHCDVAFLHLSLWPSFCFLLSQFLREQPS